MVCSRTLPICLICESAVTQHVLEMSTHRSIQYAWGQCELADIMHERMIVFHSESLFGHGAVPPASAWTWVIEQRRHGGKDANPIFFMTDCPNHACSMFLQVLFKTLESWCEWESMSKLVLRFRKKWAVVSDQNTRKPPPWSFSAAWINDSFKG